MAEIFDLQKAREFCKLADPEQAAYNVRLYEKGVYRAAKMLPAACDEIERLRAENAKLNEQADLNCDAHDSLLAQNSKQAKRIKELEAALITDRTEKLAIAFVGYEPPMTMEDCNRMAREQLKTENRL